MLSSFSSLHVLKEISWRWSRRHLLSHHLRELRERRQGERNLGLEKLREFVALEVRSAWLRETYCGRGDISGISSRSFEGCLWSTAANSASYFPHLSWTPVITCIFLYLTHLRKMSTCLPVVHRHPTSHLIICFMSCSLPAFEEGGRKVGSGKGIIVRIPSMNNDCNY